MRLNWRLFAALAPLLGAGPAESRTPADLAGTYSGSQMEVGPGDVLVIEPGHDAWTVGDEACVLYDTGVASYARPA